MDSLEEGFTLPHDNHFFFGSGDGRIDKIPLKHDIRLIKNPYSTSKKHDIVVQKGENKQWSLPQQTIQAT